MNKNRIKTFLIAIVALLLIVSMAACANDEPAAAPAAAPEDTPTVSEDNPAPPPPESLPVPGRVLPTSWSESQVFMFQPGLIVDVSSDWIPRRDGDATIYDFSDGSDLPRLSLYFDYVSGIDDFDEFFDWWLAERFYNPEYNASADVIRQEYVTYNGIKGLEIDYMVNDDGILRLALYTFVDRIYYQIRYAFEPNGDGPYLDDVSYVFNSIRTSSAELNEWPTAYLPAGTPVYTDGGSIQGYAYTDETFSDIMVDINNTSIDALSKFVDQMEKLGWTIGSFDTDSGSGYGSKGQWNVNIFMKDDGTTATLMFNFNLD